MSAQTQQTPAERAAALRESARQLRQCAQYADGPAYHEELRRAGELEAQAARIEADARATEDRRRRELAQIHLGKKQLGLDEETYRALLWSVWRVRSAADLDEAGRRAVLDHMKQRGFRPRRKGRGTPAVSREDLVRKIRAQLAAADRPDAYADGVARRMFQVERFEWCTPDQLRRIVAALAYDAKRRGRSQ